VTDDFLSGSVSVHEPDRKNSTKTGSTASPLDIDHLTQHLDQLQKRQEDSEEKDNGSGGGGTVADDTKSVDETKSIGAASSHTLFSREERDVFLCTTEMVESYAESYLKEKDCLTFITKLAQSLDRAPGS